MRYAALFLLLCSVAFADEAPQDFDSLPYTEKTATKWVEQMPPIQKKVYLSEAPVVAEGDTNPYLAVQDLGGVYEVSVKETDFPTVEKDASYLSDKIDSPEVVNAIEIKAQEKIDASPIGDVVSEKP